MPTYAVMTPQDGLPVSYRATADGETLQPGEQLYTGEMPACPVWHKASQSVAADPAKYDSAGFPVKATP